MRYLPLLFLIVLLPVFEQQVHLHTVAFYNVENLFDPEDDPDTFDDAFTPKGERQWTQEVFRHKVDQIAKVIVAVGASETRNAPLMIGLAEIENRKVLETLIAHPALRPYDYGIVHYESPDARGIDVALLYQKQWFMVEHATTYRLRLKDSKTQYFRATRDQLVVSGYLGEKRLFLTVNHWPSRRGGEHKSRGGRLAAARLHRRILDSIQDLEQEANLIVMGDFNDDPTNQSLELLTQTAPEGSPFDFKPLENPMLPLFRSGMGSLAHNDRWHLFDQILVSKSLRKNNGFRMHRVRLFNPPFLRTPSGKYKGYPYRVQLDGGTLKGYSDHFPVYGILVDPL